MRGPQLIHLSHDRVQLRLIASEKMDLKIM